MARSWPPAALLRADFGGHCYSFGAAGERPEQALLPACSVTFPHEQREKVTGAGGQPAR